MTTQAISLRDTTHLELLRPAMVEWLRDCYADQEDDILEAPTAVLARNVDRVYDGGLAAFAETEGYTVEYRNQSRWQSITN